MTETTEPTGTATYSPEDNKLRLYVGRVPRDEYLKLRADGWVSTPKQNCDFVATWTPSRRDTALDYGGVILDEDQSPAERAADRAERFADYRDKRTTEATGHADRYDAGPSAHGYQSQQRAERAANRHDKIAGRAVDAWSKAEYWTQRTAGVISNALYKSRPDVRMGRIKTLEAELRKEQSDIAKSVAYFNDFKKIAAVTPEDKQTRIAVGYTGSRSIGWATYTHPRLADVPEDDYYKKHKDGKYSLHDLLTHETHPITGAEACALFFSNHPEAAEETEWSTHLKLRLAYENQMLDAQGGRAAFVEMVPGGWIGKHQIRKVNKSPATGRVVSVTLKIPGQRWGQSEEGFHFRAFNIERLSVDTYRAPSAEDIAALNDTKKAEKAAAPKKAPCPIINPTDADAERLQALWNAEALEDCPSYMKKDFKSSTVQRITQAVYSANSQGTYARAEASSICAGGNKKPTYYGDADKFGPVLCKVRSTWGDGNTSNKADCVIILTDKPQKSLPASVWKKYIAPAKTGYSGRDSRGLSYSVNG